MAELEKSGAMARFIIDQMLEKLAKKLRHVGFDCFFQKNLGREEMLSMAVGENRILLTLNKDLVNANSKACIFLVRYKNVNKQIEEIMENFSVNLTEDKLMSRCVQCNHDVFLNVNDKEVDQYFVNVEYVKPQDID